VALLFTAVVLFQRPWVSNEPTIAVPLDVPLKVGGAISWQHGFVTAREGVYDFVLAINSGADEAEARRRECLLGGGIQPARDCPVTPSVVDLTWRLRRQLLSLAADVCAAAGRKRVD
jgi:hypothetical protein